MGLKNFRCQKSVKWVQKYFSFQKSVKIILVSKGSKKIIGVKWV